MIRLLTAGTALAAVLSTGAMAQSSSMDMMSSSAADMMSTSSEMPMSNDTMSSAPADMMSSAPGNMMASSALMESSEAATMGNTPFTILSGYTQAPTDQMATKIIGATVYDGAGQDANNLGKINDFILNKDGSIAAVIVGVGGFLGIGEKQVAVDYHALQWTAGPDGNNRFVLQTTKDELTSAPDFKTVDTNAAGGSAMAGGQVSGAMPTNGASDNMMATSSAQ